MTESQSVRILILTADAGAGHRSAANALDGALRARYGDRVVTAIVNPLHEPHAPMAFRLAEENYLNRVQATPTLYQLQHEATDSPLSAALFSLSARLLLTRTMTRLLVRWQPDVVVSVYMLYSEAVAAASARLGRPIPHITVITDLGSTVHAVWFSPHDTLCVVSSEVVRRKALTCGMDEAHVVVAGMWPTWRLQLMQPACLRSWLWSSVVTKNWKSICALWPGAIPPTSTALRARCPR